MDAKPKPPNKKINGKYMNNPTTTAKAVRTFEDLILKQSNAISAENGQKEIAIASPNIPSNSMWRPAIKCRAVAEGLANLSQAYRNSRLLKLRN
jgi:hypothetical protein